MGRITIFSLKTCPHCNRAKALLKDRGYEYYEVSLSEYPEKRTDMLALADRLTVPQIFLNEKHIGGASELGDLDEQGKLGSMLDEALKAADPSDPRLQKPDYPPKEEKGAAPLEEGCIYIGEECCMYSDLAKELETNLNISDRSYHGRTYKKCFLGTEATDFFMKRFKLQNRPEALQVGDSLMNSHLFTHVTNDHKFKDEKLFYRLKQHAEPKALNTWRVWNDRVDDPMVTLKACKKMFGNLQNKHSDKEGKVDYIAIEEDPDFQKFSEAVCEFQKSDILAMNEDTRLAFWINLYNLAVLHAFASAGIPQTNMHRMSFFDHVGYAVQGHFFSLNDIENGILRRNKTPPYHLRKMFSGNDKRLEFVQKEHEPRIHFALNCGSKSCPPIKNFTGEAVREELRIAAMAFAEMDDNVAVDPAKKELRLSKILSWYRSDFGSSDVEVAKTVLQWTRGQKKEDLQKILENGSPKIRHFDYDWSTNASKFKSYNPDSLKTESKCSIM